AFRRLPGTTWIMKPVGRAQGRGIFLITKLSQISEWRKDHTWKGDAPKAETYIVQRYVDRPYTVGNKKFDCRLYTLVTSFTPLTVWLYRGGFARFSSARYDHSAGTEDLPGRGPLWVGEAIGGPAGDSAPHMHLTNVAIQKKTAAYAASGGSKWSMRNLKLFMASKHGLPAVNRLMGDIEALIIRSLLACQQVVIQDRHSFELYGYDVLWDESLKPWLLEVNASPSLSADTDSDYRMKRAMLSDMLDVLDLEGVRSGDELSPAGLSSWLGTLPPSDAHFEGMTKASGKAGAAAEAPSTPLSEPDAAAADATAAAAGAAAAAAGAAASGAGAAPASELPAGVEVPPPIRGLAGVDAGRGMTTSPIVAPAGRQSRRD
ncbi:Ttll9, partial [Symbiodinium sp. KB8]